MKEKIKGDENNPYLNGQRIWMERYGDFIQQKRNWQVVAFISLFIALASVIGVIYLGSQNKLVPYVVQVDKLGRTVASGMAEKVDLKDVNVIKSNLQGFIVNWRSVWGDQMAQRKFIFDTYKYIKNNSLAFTLVSSEYKKNKPFQRLQSERVQIQVNSVLQIGPNNWQIDWTESKSDKQGKSQGVDNYRGLFIVEQIAPTTEKEIRDNPLGNFVTEINYSKII